MSVLDAGLPNRFNKPAQNKKAEKRIAMSTFKYKKGKVFMDKAAIIKILEHSESTVTMNEYSNFNDNTQSVTLFIDHINVDWFK